MLLSLGGYLRSACAGGLPDAVEQEDRRLIRGLLLRAGISEEVALGDADRRASLAVGAALGAGHGGAGHGGGGQQHLQDAFDRRILELLVQPGQMTAGDMAGFVRDDAAHLSGAGRLHQQPGEQEQPLSAGDEGVERGIVDDVDGDGVVLQAGRFEQGAGVGADGIFDFRVAD
jgi:hypothetical protein